MHFGFQELIVLLLIVIVLFGASRLPQLGRGLGEGISNFRRGLKGDDAKDDATPAKRAAAHRGDEG